MKKNFSIALIWLTLLPLITPLKAAIQYSGGTAINTLCVATAGTRQEASDCFEDNLVAGGWTIISGSHTTSVLLESAATPASLQMRLALTQGANTVILKGRNVANTKAATTGQFLLPAVGKRFRVIANKYQYFISPDGAPAARSFAAGGVLYTPSFTGITEAIWTTGNAISDTDTTIQPNWKACLSLSSSTSCGTNLTGNTPSTWVTANGTQWESTSTANASTFGYLSLITPNVTQFSYTLPSFYRWFDNSSSITEPLVGWGTSTTTEGKFIGQFWDAAIITDSIASETSLTFDSHNWFALTNSNTGTSNTNPRGTIVLVVP